MAAASRVDDLPSLPPRKRDAHKGDFGHVLVVGGSSGMAGAPALAGIAALRSGAGLVTVACPDVVADVVAGFEPSLMTMALESQDGCLTEIGAGAIAEHRSTVLAIGPGIGRQARTAELVRTLLATVEKPIVIDADGLHAVVGSLDSLRRRAPTVVTPHPGEFASLTGTTTQTIQADRESAAVEFARTYGVVVVLKGAGTVAADGARVFVNQTGNPGMATGGTGDVLTGIIAALIGQGLAAFDAARLATHVHGLAGDSVAAAGAEVSLIASDLLRALPTAWRALQERT